VKLKSTESDSGVMVTVWFMRATAALPSVARSSIT